MGGMGPECPKLRLKVIHEKTSHSRAPLIVDLPYAVCVWAERYCSHARPTLILEQPNDAGTIFLSASGTAADEQSINSHWKRIQRDSGVQWKVFTVKRLQHVFSDHVMRGVATELGRLEPDQATAVRGTARMMGKSVSTMERFYAKSSAHNMASATVKRVEQWRAALLQEAGALQPPAPAGARPVNLAAAGGSAYGHGQPGGHQPQMPPAARFGRGRPPSQAVLALSAVRRSSVAAAFAEGELQHGEAGMDYSEESEGSETTPSQSSERISISSGSGGYRETSAGQSPAAGLAQPASAVPHPGHMVASMEGAVPSGRVGAMGAGYSRGLAREGHRAALRAASNRLGEGGAEDDELQCTEAAEQPRPRKWLTCVVQ